MHVGHVDVVTFATSKQVSSSNFFRLGGYPYRY